MAENLIASAEQCERAVGGNADLDHAIGAAMHAQGWHAADCIANFTRSLDAAMLLVPEGYGRRMGGSAIGDQWCEVIPPSRHGIAAEYYASAATLPLALCAAALKAQAEIQRLRKEGE